MLEAARRASRFPRLLQVVTGAGATGAALAKTAVDKITFTGSTATGSAVAGGGRAADPGAARARRQGSDDRAARRRPREGGQRAVQWALPTPARSASRSSASTSRSRCTTVRRQVVEKSARARQGARGEPDCRPRRDHLPAAARHRRAPRRGCGRKGARGASAGGARRRPGSVLRADVLTGVDHTMKIMTDETFGPVLPIGARRRRGRRARERQPLRPRLERVHEGHRAGERSRAGLSRRRVGERRDHELPRPGGALRRREGLGLARGTVRRASASTAQTQTILTTRFALKREPTMFPNKAGTRQEISSGCWS